jgi:DNA-binding PadR family transcriptional regulator
MRMTFATVLVLRAIADGRCYGFDIVDATGFPTGTVYPALRRLERDGLVTSRWESEHAAHRHARPARRYYEITSAGRTTLAGAIDRLSPFALKSQAKAER